MAVLQVCVSAGAEAGIGTDGSLGLCGGTSLLFAPLPPFRKRKTVTTRY